MKPTPAPDSASLLDAAIHPVRSFTDEEATALVFEATAHAQNADQVVVARTVSHAIDKLLSAMALSHTVRFFLIKRVDELILLLGKQRTVNIDGFRNVDEAHKTLRRHLNPQDERQFHTAVWEVRNALRRLSPDA